MNESNRPTPQQRKLGWTVITIALIASLICIPIGLVRVQQNYHARKAYHGYGWWLCQLGDVTNSSGTVMAHLFNGVLVQREFGQNRSATLFPGETSPVPLGPGHQATCYTDHNYTAAYLVEHKPDVDMTAYIMTEVSLIVFGAIIAGFLWSRLLCGKSAKKPAIVVNPTITIHDDNAGQVVE